MRHLPLLLLLGGLTTAEAVVVIAEPLDVPLFGNNSLQFLEIDIDGNGVNDVRLEADRRSMRIFTLGNNVDVATFVSGGANLGGNNVPFSDGDQIGDILPNGSSWFQATPMTGSSTFLACRNIGCIGLWGGDTNFTGIRITDDEGNQRYGWIEIEAPFVNISGGWVRRHGFETEADTSIIAIPEPSSGMICLIGAMSMILKRSRKS